RVERRLGRRRRGVGRDRLRVVVDRVRHHGLDRIVVRVRVRQVAVIIWPSPQRPRGQAPTEQASAVPPPAAVAAVAQPPAEKAGAEPEPQARTQPPEQPRAEEPRPVAVAKAVTAVAEAAVTAVAAPVAAPAAVVAVPVAAVPARVEVVDVVDPVIQDSTVVDTDPVPGVHPVGDDVLIRNAEVMRHLGSVKAAVAPETSRPGVHARIPPRIVKRWPVVERGPEVRGPVVEAGPGSSEPA